MSESKEARLQIIQRIRALSPKQRLDALLSLPNTRKWVQSMPADELFMSIANVGLQDATEIVQLTSPEQFQTFLDLGIWNKDELRGDALLEWLGAARDGEPADFVRKVHGLDAELINWIFRTRIKVHDLEEDPDVNTEGVTLESPEGKYLIEFDADGEELQTLQHLVKMFIAQSPLEAARMFEGTRWDVTTELEEIAYQFRSSRLSDLGVPDFDTAQSLFVRVKVPALPKPQVQTEALARSREWVNFLAQGIDALEPTERENLQDELRFIVNAVIVAEGTDVGEEAALRKAGEQARDYLSLGIEFLAQGDVSKAADVLRDRTLKDIFRISFTLTLEVKFIADEIGKEFSPTSLSMLKQEWRTFKALRQRRPMRAVRAEGAEPMHFRSLRELEDVRSALGRVRAQAALYNAIGRPEAGLELSFGAAIAHAVLDEKVSWEPIASQRLVELGERLFQGSPSIPELRPAVRERAKLVAAEVPDSLSEEGTRIVSVVLARLLEEFGMPYLSEHRLDARQVATVVPLLPLLS